MRATLIYGAGDVLVEDVPDPKVQEPTDAVVRVLRHITGITKEIRR
jgi:threonine dehydrogenase-like Zn-dependent dehydrogenase